MKKRYSIMLLSLVCSLFIYLFYRTDKTLVNELFIYVVSVDTYIELRGFMTQILPLNELIIYSLPEGLWVFAITLTSKFLYLKIGNREINLLYVPLVFAIGLELLQLIHITNGRFDFWDIGVSVVFWAIAHYLIPLKDKNENILAPFNSKGFICTLSYGIVYLAHVWK